MIDRRSLLIRDDIVLLDERREQTRSLDGGNAAADVEVTLLEASVEGDSLVAVVREYTRLYYESPQADALEAHSGEPFDVEETWAQQYGGACLVRVDGERAGEELTWLVDLVSEDGSWYYLPGEDGTSRIGPREEVPGDQWSEADAEEADQEGCQV